MRLPKTLLLILVSQFALLPLAPLAAQESSSKGYTEIRTVGNVTEYRLPNGLQVLLMQDMTQPSTHVNVTYRVGSRHEGAGEAGMAHLLEHITFRGNKRLGDLSEYLLKLSVQMNGSTTMDRTDYIENFKADDALLGRVLDMEAARMTDVMLRPEDFEKEKPIVLNEMGMRGVSIETKLRQTLQHGVFRSHPYGHPVIGFTKDIEAVALPTLRAFYQRYYRPDNAMLMVGGTFDKERALDAIVRTFGSIPKPAQALPAPEFVEPMQPGPRLLIMRTSQSSLAFGYRVPGAAHPDAAALRILGNYLYTMRQRMAADSKLITYNGIGADMTRDPYMFGFGITMPDVPSNTPAARQDFEDIEKRLIKHMDPSTYSGLSDAQAQASARQVAGFLKKHISDPATALSLFGDGYAAGDWRLPFKMLQDLPKITTDDVIKAAFKYLQPSNRTIVRGITDPEFKKLEFKEETSSGSFFDKPLKIENVSNVESLFADFDPKAFASEKSAFVWSAPASDKITRRVSLPSGIMVSHLDKAASGEKVTVMVKMKWGKAEDMVRYPGWRVMEEMLAAGAGEFTSLQVQQIKNGLETRVTVTSLSQTAVAVVSTTKANLIRALALAKTLLAEPELPERLFDAIKAQQLATLERSATLASAKGTAERERERQHRNAELGVKLGDPEYQHSPKEMTLLWESMSYSDVKEFHNRFWSANQMSVAVVGSVPESTFAAIEKFFGPWKKKDTPDYVRFVPQHRPSTAARFVYTGPENGSATVTMRQEFPLNRRAEDYGALLVGIRVLAAHGTSGARLSDRLRAREAISYSTGNDLFVPLYGDKASVTLRATGAPKEALRLETAMKEEITRLLADGVTEAEVQTVRKQVINERGQRFSRDEPLASALLQQFDDRLNFVDAQAVDEDPLDKVTAEQVKQVLRKLLKPDAWVVKMTGATAAAR